ncbi:MAG: tetratricopeptide repeat protein [Promethearchaeota archaeon]
MNLNPMNECVPLNIKELFTGDAKLTFLVGAGCSVDPPSCLPAGRKMIKAIINYTCAESEIEKILTLDGLRFEALVEIVRDRLDPNLKLLDYLELCDKPNIQHFFLAEMIKKGHFVMTTNFDFLIEYALLQSNVPQGEIIPVITKEDFERYKNPIELVKKGNKTVYKIHGSTKNVITGENTRDSLVATIQAFGSNKEGLNVFQIEPFKRDLFDNISHNRSLVVMGYSGSDDFDIVPTLKVLNNLQTVIWINYSKDTEDIARIRKINASTDSSLDKYDKVNQILVEIKRMNDAVNVYRVDANTTKLIKELLHMKPKTSSVNFSLSPIDWLKENMTTPNELKKFSIPYKIYYDFAKYEDASRCLEVILRIAMKSGDQSWKALALTNIGLIYYEQGNYLEALKRYEEALQIDDQLGDMKGKASDLTGIGMIYYEQGNYSEALKRYEEALKIAEELGDLRGKASDLTGIGVIYKNQGNYPEALKRYEEALKIDEQLGNLRGKTTRLTGIGLVYYEQKNYPEALKRYEEALKIAEQLGDLKGKASELTNIGLIYDEQGNYPEALKRYEEALQIAEQLGDLKGKATRLTNIGVIYDEQENYPEALKRYKEALQIAEQLGDLKGKATRLTNIGVIYDEQGNYPEALKRYEAALQIDEQLGDLKGKALDLTNIGVIYKNQKNYPEALKHYEEALQIAEQLRDLKGKASDLTNIGLIYDEQGNYPEALKRYEEALEILTQLRLGNSPSAINIKDNIKIVKNKMKQ